MFAVVLTLVQVFPQITLIEYINPQWKKIAEVIGLIKRIGGHVVCTGKMCLPSSKVLVDSPSGIRVRVARPSGEIGVGGISYSLIKRVTMPPDS